MNFKTNTNKSYTHGEILKNQLESECDVNIFKVEGNVNLKEPIGGNAM